jgi:RNase P/RNase MRP subunit p30
MKEFCDLLVFDKECVDYGRKLGWTRVVCGQANVVVGGDLEKNRAAVRRKGVDVLLDPVDERRHEFDTAVAQIAKDNGVAIGFSLASMLRVKGAARARLIRNATFAMTICRKMRVPVVIVSGARNVYGMRAPLDLAAIGEVLGLEPLQAVWAVSEAPSKIAKRVLG